MTGSKLLKDRVRALKVEELPSIDDDCNQLEVSDYVDEIYQYYWVSEEKAFLKKLKFRLNAPTPYVFMLRFLKAARSETKEALRFKPSLLCAAALSVARCTLQITPAWTPLVMKYPKSDCAEMLLRFHKAARVGSLKVTYEKYSSPDLSGVAAIKPLKTLPLRFSLEG